MKVILDESVSAKFVMLYYTQHHDLFLILDFVYTKNPKFCIFQARIQSLHPNLKVRDNFMAMYNYS